MTEHEESRLLVCLVYREHEVRAGWAAVPQRQWSQARWRRRCGGAASSSRRASVRSCSECAADTPNVAYGLISYSSASENTRHTFTIAPIKYFTATHFTHNYVQLQTKRGTLQTMAVRFTERISIYFFVNTYTLYVKNTQTPKLIFGLTRESSPRPRACTTAPLRRSICILD